MTLTLLTACDGKLSTIEGLFACLEVQTVLPDEIVLLVYIQQSREQFTAFVVQVWQTYPVLYDRLRIVSSHNTDHQPGRYHGYDRWFLVGSLSLAEWLSESPRPTDIPFLKGGREGGITLMLDIDNEIEPNFISSLIEEYTSLSTAAGTDIMLAPTVMRRHTDRIQSQGIQWYSFLIPKYRFASFGVEESPQEVMMMGGNCLLGPSRLFQSIQFDPVFAYSYEDIDFTYRMTQSWVPLYVTASTVTYHMESEERSILDHKLIGSPTSAYYRMRNYLLFVRKNATWWQKVQVYSFGVWWLYVWFVLNILVYGGKERWELVKTLSRGLRDGLKDINIYKIKSK